MRRTPCRGLRFRIGFGERPRAARAELSADVIGGLADRELEWKCGERAHVRLGVRKAARPSRDRPERYSRNPRPAARSGETPPNTRASAPRFARARVSEKLDRNCVTPELNQWRVSRPVPVPALRVASRVSSLVHRRPRARDDRDHLGAQARVRATPPAEASRRSPTSVVLLQFHTAELVQVDLVGAVREAQGSEVGPG